MSVSFVNFMKYYNFLYRTLQEKTHRVMTVVEGISTNLAETSKLFSSYISSYVHFLNKFIGHLRRVASLRFERTTLIKFVKKLRFLNESLTSYDVSSNMAQFNEKNFGVAVIPLASFYLKCIELFDMLDFYLTKPLQNEIVSKTLNKDLCLSEECIIAIDDTHNHFVKFTQWMVESLENADPLLQIEVVQFARKCAVADNVDIEETSDILLQEVEPVADAAEYEELSSKWASVLEAKLQALQVIFDDEMAAWHDRFDRKKEKVN